MIGFKVFKHVIFVIIYCCFCRLYLPYRMAFTMTGSSWSPSGIMHSGVHIHISMPNNIKLLTKPAEHRPKKLTVRFEDSTLNIIKLDLCLPKMSLCLLICLSYNKLSPVSAVRG